ncbi:MAG: ROK family protein [Actinomycetota bacterium]
MRSGTNLPRIKHYNEGVVMEAIRVGEGVSRVEIADRTGLTAQTVSNIVRRLLDLGLVGEDGHSSSGSGRRRVRLRINPHARHAIGVQVDGEETSFVVIDLSGRVIERTRHPTRAERGPITIINQISGSVTELIEKADVDPGTILGLGVASPGPLDHLRGIVFNPPNLPGWHEVTLADELREKTGYPVIVDNDATAAAIGERWAGGARGVHNFAFVYMGVGVGAGIFLEDHIYRGTTTNAGEFGHLILNPDGPRCFCGSRGCVEAYCSPRAVVKAVADRLTEGGPSMLGGEIGTDPARLDFEMVCRAAQEGDELARREIEISGFLLGCGVVGLVNLLDIELVVLGGNGFRHVGEMYRKAVEEVVRERVIGPERRTVRIELSTAGDDAGAVGAASLLLDATYAPRWGVHDGTRSVTTGGD